MIRATPGPGPARGSETRPPRRRSGRIGPPRVSRIVRASLAESGTLGIAGSDTADAAGTATVSYVVPAGTPVGQLRTFQAVVIRGVGGVDSDLTQTITRVVQ